MCMEASYLQEVLLGPGEGTGAWNWHYTWLWACTCGLATASWPSTRATSALHCWAGSLVLISADSAHAKGKAQHNSSQWAPKEPHQITSGSVGPAVCDNSGMTLLEPAKSLSHWLCWHKKSSQWNKREFILQPFRVTVVEKHRFRLPQIPCSNTEAVSGRFYSFTEQRKS